MNVVKKYASLVKFPHTIFAMPFALVSYVYALTSTDTPFEWLLLVKIILCMVLARNAAMGFNRWADRDIDARNPRTAEREIPSGKISPKAAMWFVIINSLLFMTVAWWINPLCLYLSPLALFILLSYSYSKRITSWSHLILGIALAIAPVGAYIAVTGSISIYSLILAAGVATWSAGFDIFYAMQDVEFDRANSLKSIPARFSPATANVISIILHLITAYAVWIIGRLYMPGRLYLIGVILFVTILVIQHIVYRPSKISRVGKTFTLINGLASISYAAFAITDMLL